MSTARVSPIEELLTMKDVAALLRVTDRTVRRLVAEGRLPHVRVGGSIRFRPSELGAWLEARSVRPGVPRGRGVLPSRASDGLAAGGATGRPSDA